MSNTPATTSQLQHAGAATDSPTSLPRLDLRDSPTTTWILYVLTVATTVFLGFHNTPNSKGKARGQPEHPQVQLPPLYN
ncbi:hypothetical protein P8452_18912 [Trifolium repens]|nr:hypothetical protein P8452_18912 [Trifolium repens]